MLDYGARLYDPLTVRWNGVDALAEQYSSFSTYGYVGGNPMSRVDLDGREVYYTAGGTRLGQIGSSTQVVVVSDSYAKWALFTIYNFKDFSYEEESFHLDQLNRGSRRLGMTEEELNYRAMLSLMQSHESCKESGDREGHAPCSAADDSRRYYRVNGAGYMENLDAHPGTGASGAYQFLTVSWNEVAGDLNLTGFGMRTQDKAAVYYINKYGGGDAARAGDLEGFIGAMKTKWVSLPGGTQSCPDKRNSEGKTNKDCFVLREADEIFKYFKREELNSRSIVATPKGSLPINIEKVKKK